MALALQRPKPCDGGASPISATRMRGAHRNQLQRRGEHTDLEVTFRAPDG